MSSDQYARMMPKCFVCDPKQLSHLIFIIKIIFLKSETDAASDFHYKSVFFLNKKQLPHLIFILNMCFPNFETATASDVHSNTKRLPHLIFILKVCFPNFEILKFEKAVASDLHYKSVLFLNLKHLAHLILIITSVFY